MYDDAMGKSIGLSSNLKTNNKHKNFGCNSYPLVSCVCISPKMEKTDFMSASMLRQSGYGDVREPGCDKAKTHKN